MFYLIALAGFAGGSAEDDLQLITHILLRLVLWALFLPLFTFDRLGLDPLPQWMVILQPLLVIAGLLGVHFWLRGRKPGPLMR